VSDRARANVALWMSTLAFTVCFAVWMMNGVLVTHLVGNRVFDWSKTQMAALMAVPVLTGSLARLPVSILTDRYGGKPVFGILMLLAAVPTWFLSTARSYDDFWWLSLGFGLSGASFAVGIAFTSVWFGRERQGLVLGIFGAGNAGSALTSAFAPMLLRSCTNGGEDVEGWRELPKLYAVVLAATAVLFLLTTTNRRPAGASARTLAQRLAPLRNVRVWRFGLEYFLVFGGFVALSQWLVAYYVGAYQMPLVTAGLVASIFSWPSGVIRALGGWLSDRFGGRAVLSWVLGFCVAACLFLCVPRMDIESPGEGVLAVVAGKVESVSPDRIVVSGREYAVRPQHADSAGRDRDQEALVLPTIESWQEPVVKAGDTVQRKGLLARGRTHIYFQANVWIFTGLVFVLGIAMGIGKAAVYRNIPDDFPADVAVVGGIVGVIGGLGGWACPLFFGWMLGGWGLWTTCWLFFLALSVACLVWLHLSVRRRLRDEAPQALWNVEHSGHAAPAGAGDAAEGAAGAGALR
jgi:NNP family nitrate/nitrite transporter-like MFS transporter